MKTIEQVDQRARKQGSSHRGGEGKDLMGLETARLV